MLTRIGLENFKSWQHLAIDLAPITILFGTNSSGKTSVLQALLLLKQTVNSFDRKQHINFGGGERDYVDFGSYQDLVYGHDTRSEILINISWTHMHPLNKTPLEYECIWENVNDSTFIRQLVYRSENAPNTFFANYLNITRSSDTETYVVELPEQWNVDNWAVTIESCYKLSLETMTVLEQKYADSLLFIGSKYAEYFENLVEQVYYLGPLRLYPERYDIWTGSIPGLIEPDGNNTYQTLIASKKKKDHVLSDVEKWLIKLGLVDELDLVTDDDRFYQPQIRIGNIQSALVDVGFGVSQVLPVITMLLSAPEGSIILLEQPELHLHPNAQMVLADLMLYVAEERNLQLIVESHSEHLLRRLQRRIAEEEQAFANPDNIKMYFCEPSKEGSTIREVEVDAYGQIANWPPHFFGDISGDLDAMSKAALERRRRELTGD